METQDDASSSVSGCFASTTHFLLQLLSKLRELFQGRDNPSSTVQPGENATSDGLSQEHTSNRPPARNSQVANQTTTALPVGEQATKSGFVRGSKDELAEASLKLISGKAGERVEYTQHFSDEEEDVCPTCLEDYDPENPKITTRCSHHFHLGCIYEWKERSDRCPLCYRVMVFQETA